MRGVRLELWQANAAGRYAHPYDESGRPLDPHFEVRSRVSRLVTQMFFPGEPLNEKDPLYQSLGKLGPVAVAREVPVPRDGAAGSVALNWDIVLYER